MSNVYEETLVNWESKCFSKHFKGFVRSGIEDRITHIQREMFEMENRFVLPENKEAIKKQGEARISTLKTVLKGIETIPECKE